MKPITVVERSRNHRAENTKTFDLTSMKGYVYILQCSDNSYYTGSTNNLELRILQHQNGEGATHTKKRLPIKLLYYEEYDRIDEAFYREKQIQGWSRKKKEALIENNIQELHLLAICNNETNSKYFIKPATVTPQPLNPNPGLREAEKDV